MSSISGVQAQTVQTAQLPQRVGGDADGDNDGTKAAPPAPTTPFVAKPTATMGNHVNVTA